MLYGGVGLVMAMALEISGLFERGDALLSGQLSGALQDRVLDHAVPMLLPVLVAAVFCFGVGFAVLDSPGILRRIILGTSALVLLFAMVPTFAVWNIYFSPFLPVVALFWTWFCCMMYANHHRMPCDASIHQAVSSADISPSSPVQQKGQPHQSVSESPTDQPGGRCQPVKSKQKQEQHLNGQS